MKQSQWLITIAGAILVFVLYYFGDITAIKSVNRVSNEAQKESKANSVEFNFNQFVKVLGLNNELSLLVDGIEKKLKKEDGLKTEVLGDAVNQMDSLHYPELAAYYQIALAKSTGNSVVLKKAAEKSYAAFQILQAKQEMESKNYSIYFAENSVIFYRRVIEMDSANLDAKVGLATSLMDGQIGPPMEAIGILKEVIKKDSMHVRANYQLGRFSMQSRQNEKAVYYFEKVRKSDPENIDALLQLGFAYQETGNKEASVNSFEQYRNKIADIDPDLAMRVDNIIEQMKQE